MQLFEHISGLTAIWRVKFWDAKRALEEVHWLPDGLMYVTVFCDKYSSTFNAYLPQPLCFYSWEVYS